MAKIMMWVVAELACVLCIAAAFWLAWHGKDGWGWFLFVGVLLTPSWSSKSDKKPEGEPPPSPAQEQ